jgi:hypothetical protein
LVHRVQTCSKFVLNPLGKLQEFETLGSLTKLLKYGSRIKR